MRAIPDTSRRSTVWYRVALLALLVGLSAGGYLITSQAIRGDRDAAAERRVEVESVRSQALLGRARAYVAGLSTVLAGEPRATQRRFVRLAGGAAGSIGLPDALWVQRVPGAERAAYERRIGAPITQLTPDGRLEPASPRAEYLPATLTTRSRPALRRGVDVSEWDALAAAIRDQTSIFAVTASRIGSLGDQTGFYLVRAADFGRHPRDRGYLVVFVPRGWLTVTLEADPQRVAIELDGQRLEGRLDAPPAAEATFAALARQWRVDAAPEPASGLQSLLPWLALAWPIAAALIVLLVGRGIMRSRRAEREVERIFDLTVDLLCVANLDGHFLRVNPAAERILGYSTHELVARPFLDFVHPDDRQRTREALRDLARGAQLVEFENRYIRSDGAVRWLQWSTRPVPEQGLVYATARDVTDRRRAEDELHRAQHDVEASRDELRLLVDEQAALRRVATLVAHGAPPHEVFAAVTDEVSRLLGYDAAFLLRFEPDGAATFVAGRGWKAAIQPGDRWQPQRATAARAELLAGRPARVDDHDAREPSVDIPGSDGIRSTVAGPVIVEGRVWGALGVASRHGPLPADTERRLVDFTELVATAIANAESRAELTASRARVVAAGDESRRRIERDLHDATQQRLVSLGLALRTAQSRVPPEAQELRAALEQAASGLASAVQELQEITRGIHPAILSKGGLVPALKALGRRAGLPVELDVDGDRPIPERVQVAAYYVVSEAITNAVKHADATVVNVELRTEDGIVDLTIRDDGVGGADPERGSGLIGLRDRVEALGGTLVITSRLGRGTTVMARIPFEASDRPPVGTSPSSRPSS